MNLPVAYEFKRVFPTNRPFFNSLGDLAAFMPAPVYYFSDCEAFDCPAVWKQCLESDEFQLRLPHERVILEVRDGRKFQSLLVFCQQRGPDVEGFLVLKALEKKQWIQPIVRVLMCHNGELHIDRNVPDCPDEQSARIYTQIVMGILVGAINVLTQQPEIQNASVPLSQRRKFERAGVSGWIWHTVKIDPAKLRARGPDLGGTHSTPRWHIRRGHWRTITDGRRVFVRECEVGDKSRGGVVKDYEVAA